MIRSFAPQNVVEIGSGVSTACILNAPEMNSGEGRGPVQMTCIEPYPLVALKGIHSIRHIAAPCQAVPLELFDELQAGDLLFIDSSHAVKTGSDVVRIYLEILLRLQPRVLVHLDDINLPFAYPRAALRSYFGWKVTALLTALLTDNPRFSIRASLSALRYNRQRELGGFLATIGPSPIWAAYGSTQPRISPRACG